MDFTALDNFDTAAPKATPLQPKLLDDQDDLPQTTNLLDGTFDAAELPHPLKSVSTDDFEHILSDKIDTAASAIAGVVGAAAAGADAHRGGHGDDLLTSPAAAADPFGLYDGNSSKKAAATLDFINAERQPPKPQQHSSAIAPLPSVPVNVVLDDNDDDDDDVDEEEDEYVDNEVEQIQQCSPIDAAPLKASIYDDLESVAAAAATTVHSAAEKFISSEDLLGGFDSADDGDAEIAAPVAAAGNVHPVAARDPIEERETIVSTFPTAPVAKPVDVAPIPPVRSASAAVAKPPAPVAPVAISKPTVPAVADKKPRILADEIFCKIGLDAWFTPERLHPRVESLIYWRDVKKSGIVFGAGLVLLLAISVCSVISVFAYTSLLALVAAISFRIYKNVLQAVQKTPEGHPFAEYLSLELALPQEKVQELAAVAVAHVNALVVELRRLFLVEDLIDSIKFGALLWGLTYLGSWFNGMTLVILAFVALFTFPKIYENNKQDIDAHLGLVRSKIEEITEKIKAAVPIGKKAAVAATTESEKDK